MGKYVIIFNPNYKLDELDWIAMIKGFDFKSLGYNTLVLWSSGKITSVADDDELIRDNLHLKFYYYDF